MRGRQPAGLEFVDKLDGSAKAKQRLKAIVETLAGKRRVSEACADLGIKDARFDQIRIEGLQAALRALEDKPAGRPAHTPSPAEQENEQLRAEIAKLRAELEVALVRAELAVALPRAGAASKKNDREAPVPGPSIPNEEIVVNHLKNMMPADAVAEGPPRRGFAGQRTEREQEQVVRRHVVDASQRLFEQGWSRKQTADFLGLPPRTERDWRHDLTHTDLRAIPLGRTARIAPPAERDVVIQRIDQLGAGIGLPSLRLEFPKQARAELADILGGYRSEWRERHRQVLNELHWSGPGAVWAIDFHGPRAMPVDGRSPYLLAVRDLASGRVLLWRPVADATAPTAVAALEALFSVRGAPLVLKSDNGSAFIAASLRKLCRAFGVKNLYSPPRTPSYNGSIEATIGSLKIRTERYAAQDGRPGRWITADTDAAQHEANADARPHGKHGPSPDQVWAARTPIALAQRDQFLRVTAQRFQNLVAAQGPPEDYAQRRAMERDTVSQALVELGYLSITRGRSRLPICRKKVADIR